MARLVDVFISRTFRRLIQTVVWIACFVVVVSVMSAYALYKTSSVVEAETRVATEHFQRLRSNLIEGFAAMQSELSGTPCSQQFTEQLRRIAYRPDGFNEFIYAPDGVVICTSGSMRLKQPVDLGEPDIKGDDRRGLSFWMDRKLDFLGIPGAIGSVVTLGPYGAVIPPQDVTLRWSDWLDAEVTLVAADGRYWHRLGVEGVYTQAVVHGDGLALSEGKLYRTLCDTFGLHCFSLRADLVKLLATEKIFALLALIAAMILASCAASLISHAMSKYWSFEARFRRNLNAESIRCVYQPIMDLRTGEIAGCEVLARWRDVDGSVVMPNRFIDIVERNGLALHFTDLLVQRAYAELSTHVPADRRMRVSFNIFPSNLDSKELALVFSSFIFPPNRFDVVVEIIESDEIPVNAQREIEGLRRLGIKTYIDDFGTGYSNMQNLAALSVDGVKLDRAFAMAPDNSMMAQMLRHAVEMIAATGRTMVVEGVETAERLELLRGMEARIDYVQGYYISRPLDIAGLVAFLASRDGSSSGAGKIPAVPQPQIAV